MSRSRISFLLRIKASISGALFVLKNPNFIVVSIFGSILASNLVIWTLNFELIAYIIFRAPISFTDKVSFFIVAYRDIFNSFGYVHALGIIIFSVLLGLNLSLIIFALQNKSKEIPKKSGFFGLLIALLGGGCIACGTSILAPLLATFGVVSASVLISLSSYLIWIGNLSLFYSFLLLGQIAGSIKSQIVNV